MDANKYLSHCLGLLCHLIFPLSYWSSRYYTQQSITSAYLLSFSHLLLLSLPVLAMFELLKKIGCLSVKYLLFSDVRGQLLNWFLSTMMLKIDKVGLNKQLIVFLSRLNPCQCWHVISSHFIFTTIINNFNWKSLTLPI